MGSRRMGWAGHTWDKSEVHKPSKLLSENMKGRNNLKDLGTDGINIFEQILKR
jgi:hypothetical protein